MRSGVGIEASAFNLTDLTDFIDGFVIEAIDSLYC